jgi:autotransporter-associated beta strand protein
MVGPANEAIGYNNPWIIANGGQQTPSLWTAVGSGSWSNSGNWMFGVPNADGAIAVISVSTSTALTVTLDKPQTVGTLILGSGTPGVGYTLSGTGSNTLTFSNTSNSTAATISVIDGTHVINAPVVLASNLVVTSTSSNPRTLDFGTASSLADNGDHLSLTMSASDGTLILSGSDNYTGGTIVTAGTLEVANAEAIQNGTSLIVGAEAQSIFGDAVPKTALPVPEPRMLSLLGVGVLALIGYACRRRDLSA